MHAFGNFLMRGRPHAIGVVGTLTAISWFLPPFAFFMSGAPVGVLTLRRGGALGLEVILGSLLFVVALALLSGIHPAAAGAFALGIWVPVWLCSLVLRKTESQGALVLAAGGLGVLFVLLTYLLIDDVSKWWQTWFAAWFEANLPPEAAARYLGLLEAALPLMNAMMASALVTSVILTMLIARWWQALLFYPGAFRQEFYGLRLPRALAVPTLLAILLLLVVQEQSQALVRDLLVVALFMYLFQGVSAVHRIVAGRSLSQVWLVSMYGLLLLLPQMILFVACVGMVDSWMGGGPGPGGKFPG